MQRRSKHYYGPLVYTGRGMSDRGATDAWGARVTRGLLKSDSPQGQVRFGLPQHALPFMFAPLWPEAETDSANV